MDIVEAFRKAMVDVLVPEVRDLGKRIDGLEKSFNDRFTEVIAELSEHRGLLKAILARPDFSDRIVRLEERVANLESRRK